MKKILFRISVLTLAIIPALTFGQTFADISRRIYFYFVPLLTNLLLTLAVLFFAWNVARFIFSNKVTSGSGDKKKSELKTGMFWSIVALFVMLSFWGILRIVNNSFFSHELGEGSYTVDHIYSVPDGLSGTIKGSTK